MMPLKVTQESPRLIEPSRIAEVCGGRVLRRGSHDTLAPGSFVVDSREVRPGDCFVALPGTQSDGHEFVFDALQSGAAGAVVCGPVARTHLDCGAFFVRVEDTQAALLQLAAAYRREHAARVVGITGSCGKTSTKDMLAHVLERRMKTVCSPRSFNNHVGVPLTLFQLTPETRACVVELGTNAPGEIAHLASVARPEIGIVTRIDESHLMRLGSLEGVAREKAQLLAGLPDTGLAILNGDDKSSAVLRSSTNARVQEVRVETEADWFATDISFHGLGTSFRLQGETPVTLPRMGTHNVFNALFTAAAAAEIGVPLEDVVEGLATVPPTARRLECKQIGDISVIDDTYNSNPASARAALLALAGLSTTGRRLVVMGEMLELGGRGEELHRGVGADVASGSVDVLVTVGDSARPIADAAVSHGMDPSAVHCLGDHAETVAYLSAELRGGDWLLCKASRGVGLDSVVDDLQALLGE